MNQLKQVRETNFLSFEEISEQTNISIECLQAIEEENFASISQKSFTIKQYIRNYADFLEIDPKPIIESYQNSLLENKINESNVPLSRKREKKKKVRSSGFFSRYKYHLIALMMAMVLAVSTWIISITKEPVLDAVPVSTDSAAAAITNNRLRPVFTLQKFSKAFPNSESWMISKANILHIHLQSLGNVSVRIRENGAKGNVLVDKALNKNSVIDLSGKKWIVIRMDKPNLTVLTVNDVLIDTTTETGSYIYEFKISSE